jgi:hypothetical protein
MPASCSNMRPSFALTSGITWDVWEKEDVLYCARLQNTQQRNERYTTLDLSCVEAEATAVVAHACEVVVDRLRDHLFRLGYNGFQ